MPQTDLLRLINSREAWAFVGSGPSIDAGLPSWGELLSAAKAGLTAGQVAALETDTLFKAAIGRHDLPAAFMALEEVAGRAALDDNVQRALARTGTPGAMHNLLAELPFAGYITTNYDHLLEEALNRLEPGWAPVGNVGDEVRKASGSAERVVWHVHGSVELPTSRSRLVLTTEDYDRMYVDNSRVLQQLTGLLAHRRIVVVGFGFRDDEVMRMLHTVGRMTDPARPIFALVERGKEFRHAIDRQVFLRQYKVDVQPYRNEDGKHQDLRHTLSVYCGMSLRRSLKYGQSLKAAPSYDPETTGLLIYNDFVLKAPRDVPQELRISILKSRIMSICESKPCTKEQLSADLQGILDALVRRVDNPVTARESLQALQGALSELIGEGLLEPTEGSYRLTSAGRETVLDKAATSGRLEEQFAASISHRAGKRATTLGVSGARASQVVEAFFREAIERRALGVALAFATGGTPNQQDYHALALLQSAGEWLDTATDAAEALVVIETIQDVFRQPSAAESSYIATAIQARFVLHLLSLDNDTLAARQKELHDSFFLIDSSTLIPWLAIGSVGHKAANSLVTKLQRAGSMIATTWPLAEELAEHARWAQKEIRDSGGFQSVGVFEAATGRAGIKTNAFLEGYISHYGRTPSTSSFDQYLASCLDVPRASNPVPDSEFTAALIKRGIPVLDFDVLAASDTDLRQDRDSNADQIRIKRQSAGNYTHARQVRAEGEAVALLDRVRGSGLVVTGREVGNGYFVSNTAVLNQVSRSQSPITMRMEAAISWLATLQPAAEEDVNSIMSELLWELQERRMNILDQSALLEAFGPLIAAAKERLEEVLPQYQVLTAQRYGGDARAGSFAVNDLDVPVVLEGALADRVQELEAQVAAQAAELATAQERGQLADSERVELERARRKERGAERYNRRKTRLDGKGGKR